MAPPRDGATEDQFLGALLGLAIGDALGRPVAGLSADEIERWHGKVAGYVRDVAAPADAPPGEITDNSEIVLALVESLTTNDGLVDPVNVNARLGFLVQGPSRESMSAAVIAGVEAATEADGLVAADVPSPPEIAVALRGVPIGLLHAVGAYDPDALRRESAIVSRLTHGGGGQADLTALVARAVCAAARFGDDTEAWARVLDAPDSPDAPDDVVTATAMRTIDAARAGSVFEDPVFAVVAAGGDADTNAALAGAVAGARFGASGILQELIDGLDARIYISLAAPWFYRTAIRRAGTVIDLRRVDS